MLREEQFSLYFFFYISRLLCITSFYFYSFEALSLCFFFAFQGRHMPYLDRENAVCRLILTSFRMSRCTSKSYHSMHPNIENNYDEMPTCFNTYADKLYLVYYINTCLTIVQTTAMTVFNQNLS